MSYLKLARQARRDEPKPKESKNAPGFAPVTDISTARTLQRDPDERRLIAAGWTPKDRCGPLKLTIWAHPETGFYSSRDAALHRLDNPLPRSPGFPGNLPGGDS